MIKIALVDDHVVLRKSLAVLIELFGGFTITIQADNGRDFIQQLKKTKELPDIVLMDINMPDMGGLETAQWLKINQPGIKVVILSMLKNEHIIIRMLKNGIRGYILKDSDPAILRDALMQVHTNGYYYNEFITPHIINNKNKQGIDDIQLSAQELIFIRLVCTEKTYKQIADEMHVSHRTVDGYRDILLRKLNVASRVGIVLYAMKNQLI